jgi:hypothetical protein
MEKTTYKQNSREYIPGETVIVANSKETIVSIPIIVEPIQIEVALGTILVEVEHVAIAIDLRNGTLYEKLSGPPLPDFFTEAVSHS